MTEEAKEPSDEIEIGLVMPFVCCISEGGSYDDNAFVAGVRFGWADRALQSRPRLETFVQIAAPEMEAQYDLLAMEHGYALTVEPWGGLTRYTFTRDSAGGVS